MISNRHINLKLGTTTINRHIPKGCPQGGVLSPFLWNLVINELLKQFEKAEILQAFADDLNLTITGFDVTTTFELATHYLKHINKWCEDNGIKFQN